MIFFFVGGVSQQVSQVLKRDAGRCIACGSFADLVEYEKLLKMFFVPVWKWPGKEPLMHCRNCDLFFPPSISAPPPPPEQRKLRSVADVLRCQYCNQEVSADFRFCPFCGSNL